MIEVIDITTLVTVIVKGWSHGGGGSNEYIVGVTDFAGSYTNVIISSVNSKEQTFVGSSSFKKSVIGVEHVLTTVISNKISTPSTLKGVRM